ncbi:MAG: hypothetical protein Q7J73_01935 [Dehalococcoidales bacterium]|nr:hypothetical protein [Dehalococcoidales bacterium]
MEVLEIMLDGEKVESQVDQAAQTVPAEETHPTDAIVAAQPGAEQKTPAPAKATPKYTEAELTERVAKETSTLQQQQAGMQQRLAQIEQERQIAELERQEATEKAKDQQAIDQGIITTEEATRRSQIRQNTVQLEQGLRQRYQQAKIIDQQTESRSRFLSATYLADKYGVPVAELMNNKDFGNPEFMVLKAENLQLAAKLEKAEKAAIQPEHYDGGPGEGVGGDDNKLSSRELARKAYSKK